MTKSMIDGGFGDQTLKTERLGVCQALSFRRERSKRWRCLGWPFPWSPGPAQGQGLVGWHWLRGQGDRAGRWSTEGRRVAPPGYQAAASAISAHSATSLWLALLFPWERGSRQGTPTHLESSREVGWPARPHGQLQPHRGVVQGLAPPNELAHFRVEATAGPGAHLGDHLPCAAASTRGPPVPMEVGILPPQGSLWGLLLKLLGSWQ